MCAECEHQEFRCAYCGDECYGTCEDPDSCPTCWIPKGSNEPMSELHGDGSELDECMDDLCRCNCHDHIYEDMEYRWEAGVFKTLEYDGEPYIRKGAFPLLSLPLELRKRIYTYAFAQRGEQRVTPTHRGTIHTALLRSCRQIYKEAGELPLTVNQLCFDQSRSVLDFIGFSLHKTVRHLLKSLHVEMAYSEWYTYSTDTMLKRLPEVPLTHLGITFKGFYT